MKRTLPGTMLALIVLAGCGSSPSDEPAAEPEPTAVAGDEGMEPEAMGGPGSYTIVPPSGGVITIDLTGEQPDDDLISRAEVLRDEAGFEPGEWVAVTVDNTEGSEIIYLDYGPEVVNDDGDTTQLNDPTMSMGDWVAAINDSSLTDDLYFTWDDMVDEQILPGAKYEGYLYSDHPIGNPARVFMDDVEGYLSD